MNAVTIEKFDERTAQRPAQKAGEKSVSMDRSSRSPSMKAVPPMFRCEDSFYPVPTD